VRRAGLPEDIAEACLFLAGDGGGFVSGQVIHVNGGQMMI
jgi:3-oxoacyl-[acyl-carrier protein] reductase